MITYRDLDLIELDTDLFMEEIFDELEREMMDTRLEVEDGSLQQEQILQGEEGRQPIEGGEGGLDAGAAPIELEQDWQD